MLPFLINKIKMKKDRLEHISTGNGKLQEQWARERLQKCTCVGIGIDIKMNSNTLLSRFSSRNSF